MSLFNLVFYVVIIISMPKASSGYCHPQVCGSTTIEYPFGIGNNCSLDTNFTVYCNISVNPPRVFTTYTNLEILNISVLESKVEVKAPVLSSCPQQQPSAIDMQIVGPFSFSVEDNVFAAVGCNGIALLMKGGDDHGEEDQVVLGGCMSYCQRDDLNRSRALSSCHGLDCCQTTIPWPLKALSVHFRTMDSMNKDGVDDEECNYAFMAKKRWMEESTSLVPNVSTIENVKYVPAVLDWGLNSHDYGSCIGSNDSASSSHNDTSTTICGPNSYCSNSTASSLGYVCHCQHGFTGNPYSECTDIDECANAKDNNPCGDQMVCTNIEGGYTCSIPFEYFWILTLVAQGVGLMLFLGCFCVIDRQLRRSHKKRLKRKYFKRNGGPLLEKQMSSCDDTVQRIQLFTSKELKKATEDYNSKRILGRGGQGTVYKGMLTDGRIVAVKMSKQFDPDKVEQFVNEIVVLSKINHRNVVKVLGCCLETEFPLLVYEFVPNGTLFRYIQDRDEKCFPFSWDTRLQIAAEVGVALYYMHSQASTLILHRDIKSTNILLDETCRAKVADFGISMSISIDQTHKTTMVRGTHGYLDPEYFRTSQFTDKSDVYSFGVVLVELLTGLEPIFSISGDEHLQALVSHFVKSMNDRCLLRIVDARVVKATRKSDIMAIANLAQRCLNMEGDERPTMKVVAMELEAIRKSRSEASSLGKSSTNRVDPMIPGFCNPYI